MIALIWQNEWNVLGCDLAEKLVAAGFEVRVFVRNAKQGGSKKELVLPMGATLAKSQIAAVTKAEAILTLLNTSQEVEEAYLGSGGIMEHAAPSSLFIDLSTSNPQLAKELYALAAVHDHCFIEAPIDQDAAMDTSMDAASPKASELKIYAAGEPDNLRRALPILRILTPHVSEVGLPGSGSTLKLASQIALANMLMGLVEAITFSMAFGVESKQILKVLEGKPSSLAIARAFGKRIIDEEFYYGVELQQFFFDLSGALDAADESNLALPGLETAHQLYDLLVLVGGAKKGIHALALIYYDEERCTRHGLNWELAQQAMDVYENVEEAAYADDDYDDEDYDDLDFGQFPPHHGDGPPIMNRFFSPN